MKKNVLLLLLLFFGYFLSAQVPFIKNYGDTGMEEYLLNLHYPGASSDYAAFGHGRTGNQSDFDLTYFELNENFEIEQTILIERVRIQELKGSIAFSDGNFILAATTDETPTNRGDILFLGLNADAEVIWESILGDLFSDNLIASCLTNEDKAIFLIDEVNDTYESNYRLISFASDGTVDFDIALDWGDNDFIFDCTPAPNGGFLVGGNHNGQVQIAHYSSGGELIWENTIPEPWASNMVLNDLIYDEASDQILVGLSSNSEKYFLGLDDNVENVLFQEELNSFVNEVTFIQVENGNQSCVWIYDRNSIEVWRKISANQYLLETTKSFGNVSDIKSVLNQSSSVLFVRDNEILKVDKSIALPEEAFPLGLEVQLSPEEFRSFASFPNGKWFASSSGEDLYGLDLRTTIFELDASGNPMDTIVSEVGNAWVTNSDLTVAGSHLVEVYSKRTVNADNYFHIINIYNSSNELEHSLSIEEEKSMLSYISDTHTAALSDGTFFALIDGRGSDRFLHLFKVDENGTLLDTFDLSNQQFSAIRNMKSLPNDEVVITGRDLQSGQLRVLKLNPDGSIAWNNTYNDGDSAIGYGISVSPDGLKIAVSSRIFRTIESGIYWAELDLDGNVLDEHFYIEGPAIFFFPFIHYNSYGELLIQATVRNPFASLDREEFGIGYWKYNSAGELIDATTYYPPYDMFVWESQLIENDYMALVGREDNANESDAFLMVLNANGDLISTNDHLIALTNLNLSPNPSNGFCQVQLDNSYLGMIQLELFDLQGHLLYAIEELKTTQRWKTEFNYPHLPNGNYTVRITTKEGSVSKLWIKQ